MRSAAPWISTIAEWDRSHAINVRSFFLTSKYVLPHMVRQGRGAIVNVSSIGSIRWTGLSYLAYATSKAAVNQLTQSLALEYAASGFVAMPFSRD